MLKSRVGLKDMGPRGDYSLPWSCLSFLPEPKEMGTDVKIRKHTVGRRQESRPTGVRSEGKGRDSRHQAGDRDQRGKLGEEARSVTAEKRWESTWRALQGQGKH